MQKTTRSTLVLATGLTIFPVLAHAQDAGKPRLEFGAGIAGLSVAAIPDSDTEVFFGVPSPTSIVSPMAYLSIFAGPKVAIEPQLGLMVLSDGDNTTTMFSVAGQFDYFFTNATHKSAYVFARAWFVTAKDGDRDAESNFALGGGLGYRIPVTDRVSFRIEGRYDHFFDEPNTNLITAQFCLGVGL